MQVNFMNSSVPAPHAVTGVQGFSQPPMDQRGKKWLVPHGFDNQVDTDNQTGEQKSSGPITTAFELIAIKQRDRRLPARPHRFFRKLVPANPPKGTSMLEMREMDIPDHTLEDTGKDPHWSIRKTVEGRFPVAMAPYHAPREGEESLGVAFTVFDSAQEFFEYMHNALNLKADSMRFFELCDPTSPRRMYFDIDIPLSGRYAGVTQQNGDYLGRRVYQTAQAVMKQLWNIDAVASVCTSHGPTKLSYHIVFYTHVLPNYHYCKQVYQRTMDALGAEPGKECVDEAVYGPRQQFRLLGSSKSGGGRVKIPINSPDHNQWTLEQFLNTLITDHTGKSIKLPELDSVVPKRARISVKVGDAVLNQDLQPLIDLVSRHITQCDASQVFEFSDIVDKEDYGLVRLTRRSTGYCGVCDREHENDNASVMLFESGCVMYRCFRAEKAKVLAKPREPESVTIDYSIPTGPAPVMHQVPASSSPFQVVQSTSSLLQRAAQFDGARLDVIYGRGWDYTDGINIENVVEWFNSVKEEHLATEVGQQLLREMLQACVACIKPGNTVECYWVRENGEVKRRKAELQKDWRGSVRLVKDKTLKLYELVACDPYCRYTGTYWKPCSIMAQPERVDSKGRINTWTGFQWRIIQGYPNPKEFLSMSPRVQQIIELAHLIILGDKHPVEYDLAKMHPCVQAPFCFAAHLVQHPEELSQCMLCLVGLQGCGKDALLKIILMELMGGKNGYVAPFNSAEDILSRFNAPSLDKLILSIPEFKPETGSVDKWKELITGEDMYVQRKGEDGFFSGKHWRVVATSNWISRAAFEGRRNLSVFTKGSTQYHTNETAWNSYVAERKATLCDPAVQNEYYNWLLRVEYTHPANLVATVQKSSHNTQFLEDTRTSFQCFVEESLLVNEVVPEYPQQMRWFAHRMYGESELSPIIQLRSKVSWEELYRWYVFYVYYRVMGSRMPQVYTEDEHYQRVKAVCDEQAVKSGVRDYIPNMRKFREAVKTDYRGNLAGFEAGRITRDECYRMYCNLYLKTNKQVKGWADNLQLYPGSEHSAGIVVQKYNIGTQEVNSFTL